MTTLRRPELPELRINADHSAVKALLLTEEHGEFDESSLNLGVAACQWACDRLSELGWCVKPIPAESGQYFRWGIRGSEDERRNVVERFRSSAYREWREEALAWLAGKPRPAPKEKPALTSGYTAADFTGLRGSRLQSPQANSPMFRLIFVLMHMSQANPATAECAPIQFVAAVHELVRAGWPIDLRASPLIATWSKKVPRDVLEAWRDAFGARGQSEALNGTLGRDK
jgi:hypothetical protein